MNSEQTTIQEGISIDQSQVVRMENLHLRVDVSPQIGGRITSIFNKAVNFEFLWKNERLPLQASLPGSPYDPNFYGGIDEVIPCDLPETIAGLYCPDHGELWTLPLQHQVIGEALELRGTLPIWGLLYEKRIALRSGAPWIDMDYRLTNLSGERRVFLWKLHAAAALSPGDQVACPARFAAVADPAWSRWKTTQPFDWPMIGGSRADLIPPPGNETDFLFLYGLRSGHVSLRREAMGCELAIAFDPRVFPYVCYFASYGGMDGHYTAVLEPSTAMPVSVREAAALGQCSALDAGETLATRVSVYAGPMLSNGE